MLTSTGQQSTAESESQPSESLNDWLILGQTVQTHKSTSTTTFANTVQVFQQCDFLPKKWIRIEWTMVETWDTECLCRSGAKNCHQVGHSKLCKKGLWPRNPLHWRLLWVWALSYPSNSWGVGSWKRIFARSFWETWQLGWQPEHAYQTLGQSKVRISDLKTNTPFANVYIALQSTLV